MALDAQRNWNIEMSQSKRLEAPDDDDDDDDALAPRPSPPRVANANTREVHLPVEIILQIVSFLPRGESSQPTLGACTLVSKTWYDGSILRLYQHPYVSSRNFQEFVRTVCPSKNAHIKRSELAEMVEWFDMSNLSYDSSKSLTARLLARLKQGLKRFVAPQASFAINSFASLSKCTKLEYLNLSLISASISMKLLYQTLKPLKTLRVLFLPRSSNKADEKNVEIYWPPKLEALHLAGGIDDRFLDDNLHQLPETLKTMSIQHCSHVSPSSLAPFLQSVGPQLRELKISHPMRLLTTDSLDPVLSWCPNLQALRISVELATPQFLSHTTGEHPLNILILDSTGDNLLPTAQYAPSMITDQLTKGLTSLRKVIVDSHLGWKNSELYEQGVEDLSDELEELDSKTPLGIEPGVWVA